MLNNLYYLLISANLFILDVFFRLLFFLHVCLIHKWAALGEMQSWMGRHEFVSFIQSFWTCLTCLTCLSCLICLTCLTFFRIIYSSSTFVILSSTSQIKIHFINLTATYIIKSLLCLLQNKIMTDSTQIKEKNHMSIFSFIKKNSIPEIQMLHVDIQISATWHYFCFFLKLSKLKNQVVMS